MRFREFIPVNVERYTSLMQESSVSKKAEVNASMAEPKTIALTNQCRAVASAEAGGQLSPSDLFSQTNQVCGWICFL